MSETDFDRLDRAGLNQQAVFNLDALPVEMSTELRQRFDPDRQYRQLILIGHGGRSLWDEVQAAGIRSDDPIDDFSVDAVEQWFAGQFADRRFQIVYPGETSVGLQGLGQLAGWHHASPFMVGINETWGTWYAYRVVLLADTDILPTPPVRSASPCLSCAAKPCIAACPGKAMDDGVFVLEKCVAYRKQPASRCRETCVARTGCPVGTGHRYCDAQIKHCYSISMRMIERYY